jgi:hypothetical protein
MCARASFPQKLEAARLIGGGFHTDDFTRFAHGRHLEGTAANFAIRRVSLTGEAGVYDYFAVLATVRALNVGEFFHAAI